MKASTSEKTIKERLEAARTNLLDTSLRNRLLNYKPSRRYGVEAKGESPEEIFDILYREERQMRFRGLPDEPLGATEEDLRRAQAQGLYDFGDQESLKRFRALAEEEFDSFVGTISNVNVGDYIIDCDYQNTELRARLKTTFRNMRKSIEEQGVNILFVALGMLRWRESDDSQLERKAPLLFVPVELKEAKSGPFRLKYSGEEAGPNLPLKEKLKQEFGIALPDVPEDLTTINLEKYFTDVSQAVRHKRGWSVDTDSVVLSFFSFAKYLMYKDLGGDAWPEEKKPWGHPIIGALLGDDGFRYEEPAIPDNEHLDGIRPVERCHEVVDADSSQLRAIMEAISGRTMVIQGPPGTGKSQTITNLIAEMVGEGKSVLFVSEKMAALEVVHENLKRVGLHDLCLELHSHKANKKEFYGELDRSIGLGKPDSGITGQQMEELQRTRDELNEYCDAVNSPIDPFGVTPFQAIGRLSQLPEPNEEALKLPCEQMKSWDDRKFKEALSLVKKMEARIKEHGLPSVNPFFGSRLGLVLPEEKFEIRGLIADVIKCFDSSVASCSALAQAMDLDTPLDRQQAEFFLDAAKFAVGAPDFANVALNDDRWTGKAQLIRDCLLSMKIVRDTLAKWVKSVHVQCWRQDVLQIRAAIADREGELLRWLSSDYRAARRTSRSFFKDQKQGDKELIEVCDAILAVQEARAKIKDGEGLAAELFGAQWKGEATDSDHLSKLLDWILELKSQAKSGSLPAGIAIALQSRGSSSHLQSPIAETVRATGIFADRLSGMLDRISAEGDLRDLIDSPFDQLGHRLQRMQDNVDSLTTLAGFNVLFEEASEVGMVDTVMAIELDKRSPMEAVSSFKRKWFTGVLKVALDQRPALRKFDRPIHEQTAQTYRRLDDLMLKFNQAKVAKKHWNDIRGIAQWGKGEVGWLRTQCARKRAHKSIRQAMENAGQTIRRLKPVFMMSPLSVASYLGSQAGEFDVVIFDEASQVKPEDAFGAILRAPQTIVVGDSKQLPPTSFFDNLTQAIDDEDDEANVVRDIESVLSLMDSKVRRGSANESMLEWHYRSRHHTLIAVSNALFYDSRLFIFPSARDPDPYLGLRFNFLPDTVYGRGGSRRNPLEAQAVAKAAYEHTREHPDKSLGIVAFSQSQADAIDDAMEMFRKQDGLINAFEERHPHERLFTKNLESVQGDERDVIFISVGYGKDATGKFTMNFGPLSQDGGERRLNVLISRSRMRCEVFCNFKASDLRVTGDTGRGVHSFQTFLQYAETGELVSDAPSGKDTDSPFEDSVIGFLTSKGFDVEPQVGVAGFFIDIGVRHPSKPGRFVLGIECDGASYHSSRSARDRDKLRQRILEDRGWRIHRIWSTDWWLNRGLEQKRLIEAVERSIQLDDDGQQYSNRRTVVDLTHRFSRVESDAVEPVFQIQPYQVAECRFDTRGEALRYTPPARMASWINRILEIESPIHYTELVKRIRTGAGAQQAGSAIKEAVYSGIRHGEKTGSFEMEGEFVWRKGRHPIEVRDRSEIESRHRKVKYVHPDEIREGVVMVVKMSISIVELSLANEVLSLFGFDRKTDDMRLPVLAAIADQLHSGALVIEGGKISLADN